MLNLWRADCVEPSMVHDYPLRFLRPMVCLAAELEQSFKAAAALGAIPHLGVCAAIW
jgi:hypothetical protein